MATSRVFGLVSAAMLAAVAAGAQQVSAPANRDRRVITTEEIEYAKVNTAYQVVEKLRPEFFRRMTRQETLGAGSVSRGTTSRSGQSPDGSMASQTGSADAAYALPSPPTTTAVFVDGTQMGGTEELEQIQSNTVEEIRYLSGTDAQTKYGPRFAAGVIEVKLKTH